MSIQSANSVAQYATRSLRHIVFRAAVVAIGTVGLLASLTHVSNAQTTTPPMSASPASAWELRFTSGGLIATGSQRDAIKDAQLSGVQLSWLVRPSIAMTSTFGWARSRDRVLVNTPKLDVFTSDLGVEGRGSQWFAGHAVTFSPFAGLGAGMRSYNYRKLDVNATNNLAGYGSVGSDLGIGRVGLRLEVRDYATGFKPLVGAGKSDTRNDVVIMAALKYNRRHASQN